MESVDEATGRIVKKGDLDGLKQAVLDIKAHPVSAQICRQKGRRYDKYDRFAEYVKLYRELKEQTEL